MSDAVLVEAIAASASVLTVWITRARPEGRRDDERDG